MGPLWGKIRVVEWTHDQQVFLEQNHAAAMITLRADGTPGAVRVGVGLVDGKLWSSGTCPGPVTRQCLKTSSCA